MRITVDRTARTGLGICEAISPDVFEVDEEGEPVLRTDEIGGRLAEVCAAAEGCPTAALALAE